MREFGRRRPSAALVVSIIALVVAASGTALAAGRLVNGDSLIKKHSLSGDRLRSDSVTGHEIKLSSMGQVPSAKNAADLGGRPASAYALAGSGVSAGGIRTGLVTANGGQTVKLASFGPFTVSLKCNDNHDGTFDAVIDVDSTSTGSEADGLTMTPGTPQPIADAGPDSQFLETNQGGGTLADFVAPPQAWMGYLVDAIFMPGTNTPCAASLLVSQS